MTEKTCIVKATLLDERVQSCIEVEGRWYSIKLSGDSSIIKNRIDYTKNPHIDLDDALRDAIGKDIEAFIHYNKAHPSSYEISHKVLVNTKK